MKVTKGRLIDDLKKIGVEDGDHLAVLLSFKSIGYVEGGPNTLIDALLETVGPNGTVMMNTYTPNFPLSKIESDYIFDRRFTPALTGLVPNVFMKRQDAIRSGHPVCSVAAIGNLAEYLTEGHNEKSPLHMPYSSLANKNGKYLCIGLREAALGAIRHEAQRLAGLFDVVPMLRGARYRNDGGDVKLYIFNTPPCVKRLPALIPRLEKMGVVKISRIGMAYSIFGPARDTLDAMTEMLKEKPTLNLCDDISCLWCREFERRKNLYRKINNPKNFQKNPLVIKSVTLINKIRLREYSYLSYNDEKGSKIMERTKMKILSMLNTTLKRSLGSLV